MIISRNGLNFLHCPSVKASIIAQLFLDEVICRFGFPVRVISDNGVQFLSKVFVQLCDLLGIHHQRTPLYHPQSNLSERVNRTLKPILASLAHNDSKSWDVKLSQIAFALRTAPSESTEHSPAFLMFGRHPRQPIDLLLSPPHTPDSLPTPNDLSTYRRTLLTQLLPAYKTAREILDLSHQRQTSTYNMHRRPLQFETGDLVWVAALSGIAMGKWRGSKLEPRRDGPYRILKRLTSLTYELEHLQTNHHLSKYPCRTTYSVIIPSRISLLLNYYSSCSLIPLSPFSIFALLTALSRLFLLLLLHSLSSSSSFLFFSLLFSLLQVSFICLTSSTFLIYSSSFVRRSSRLILVGKPCDGTDVVTSLSLLY